MAAYVWREILSSFVLFVLTLSYANFYVKEFEKDEVKFKWYVISLASAIAPFVVSFAWEYFYGGESSTVLPPTASSADVDNFSERSLGQLVRRARANADRSPGSLSQRSLLSDMSVGAG
tara:strand:+ start:295 stop:651 length:357 start_codon:yes stop_codon:yes gene_type:complete